MTAARPRGPIERALARELGKLPPGTRVSALAALARTAARHADAADSKMFPQVAGQLRAALEALGLTQQAHGAGDWLDDLAARRERRERPPA